MLPCDGCAHLFSVVETSSALTGLL
jgi:hypothetical protein